MLMHSSDLRRSRNSRLIWLYVGRCVGMCVGYALHLLFWAGGAAVRCPRNALSL